MNRVFYSLPDPREVGLKWKPYEHSRQKVERIDERLQQAQRARAEIEQEIKHLDDSAVRQLAAAVLAGEDDPATHHDEHAKLVERLRVLKREEAAVSQALPQAEEELRQTVFEYQRKWKDEADTALEKAIAAERKAYDKALELIQEPRRKRLYAENLSGWVRYPQPTFSEPSDVAALSAIQNLGSGPHNAEQRMQERRAAEQLEAEQEEGGSVSEYDAIGAAIERTAREEQDDLDRRHGQFILDVTAAKSNQGVDPLLEVLSQAHRAKAEEADQ